MKDVTSTSFGLLIAFLLPGLATLLASPYFSETARASLKSLLTQKTDVGFFLLLALVSIVVGLQLSICRWILFEKWLCRHCKLTEAAFEQLKSEGALSAFRAAVDEHYRYHQFWGSMAIVLPIHWLGVLHYFDGGVFPSLTSMGSFFWIASSAFLFLLIVTIAAAKDAFARYVNRGTAIMNLAASQKEIKTEIVLKKTIEISNE